MDRLGFLEEACACDEQLKEEILSLLAAGQHAGGLADSPGTATITADTPAHLPTGQRISHYEMQSLLGAGGMGQVYLALDRRLERNVALKLLPQGSVNDPELAGRFGREARAASALNHPNCITVYDIVGIRNWNSSPTWIYRNTTRNDRLD